MKVWHPWQLKKSKSWGLFWRYQLIKQHCQFSPFGPIFEVNGLNWQCYLAGSSKMAPRILIFSIAIGADYSYEVKNNEIQAPAFFKHDNSFIATVSRLRQPLQKFSSLKSTASAVYEGRFKVILLLQVSSHDFEPIFIVFCLN